MAKVFNWHLNREMEYPYEGSRPDKQFAIVFNINRCIGCQTCTMACRNTWTFNPGQEYMWWNNVETKPYGGYPHNWDVKLLEMMGEQSWDGDTYAGKTIFEDVPDDKRMGLVTNRTGDKLSGRSLRDLNLNWVTRRTGGGTWWVGPIRPTMTLG